MLHHERDIPAFRELPYLSHLDGVDLKCVSITGTRGSCGYDRQTQAVGAISSEPVYAMNSELWSLQSE